LLSDTACHSPATRQARGPANWARGPARSRLDDHYRAGRQASRPGRPNGEVARARSHRGGAHAARAHASGGTESTGDVPRVRWAGLGRRKLTRTGGRRWTADEGGGRRCSGGASCGATTKGCQRGSQRSRETLRHGHRSLAHRKKAFGSSTRRRRNGGRLGLSARELPALATCARGKNERGRQCRRDAQGRALRGSYRRGKKGGGEAWTGDDRGLNPACLARAWHGTARRAQSGGGSSRGGRVGQASRREVGRGS
jgi:hypothetical protein